MLVCYVVFLTYELSVHGQICTKNETLPNGYECDGQTHILFYHNDIIGKYCGRSAQGNEPVVSKLTNGRDAEVAEVPYMAAIVWGGSHQCGGCLIDNIHIITAAHCLLRSKTLDPTGHGIPPDEIKVILGTTGRYVRGTTEDDPNVEIREIFTWAQHEGYIQQEFNSYGALDGKDIAIIIMAQPVPFSPRVWPICVATLGSNLGQGNQNKVFLSGFGSDSRHFRQVLQVSDSLRLLSETECERKVMQEAEQIYYDGQLCTVPGDSSNGTVACRGDSGGPLVQSYNGQLYALGIVSYGPKNCQNSATKKADVYTDVRYFSRWIQYKTSEWEDYTDDDKDDTRKKPSSNTTDVVNFAPSCGGKYCFRPSDGDCTFISSFYTLCNGQVSCSKDLMPPKDLVENLGDKAMTFAPLSVGGGHRGQRRKCTKWDSRNPQGKWKCLSFRRFRRKRRQVNEIDISNLVCPVLSCISKDVLPDQWTKKQHSSQCPYFIKGLYFLWVFTILCWLFLFMCKLMFMLHLLYLFRSN